MNPRVGTTQVPSEFRPSELRCRCARREIPANPKARSRATEHSLGLGYAKAHGGDRRWPPSPCRKVKHRAPRAALRTTTSRELVTDQAHDRKRKNHSAGVTNSRDHYEPASSSPQRRTKRHAIARDSTADQISSDHQSSTQAAALPNAPAARRSVAPYDRCSKKLASDAGRSPPAPPPTAAPVRVRLPSTDAHDPAAVGDDAKTPQAYRPLRGAPTPRANDQNPSDHRCSWSAQSTHESNKVNRQVRRTERCWCLN